MLRRRATDAHGIGVAVEPALDRLQHGLVLPARDAALGARRTLIFQRAALACARPIAADRLAVLHARAAVRQPFTGRTAIDVVGSDVDEVLLPEAAFRLG